MRFHNGFRHELRDFLILDPEKSTEELAIQPFPLCPWQSHMAVGAESWQVAPGLSASSITTGTWLPPFKDPSLTDDLSK